MSFSGPAPDTNIYDELGVTDVYDDAVLEEQYDSIGNDTDPADARSQGYEGLDQSDLAIQPQPHDYIGLATPTTQQTTDQLEMSSFDHHDQNTVSQRR